MSPLEFVDQLPVLTKQVLLLWASKVLPASILPAVSALLSVVPIVAVFGLLFALTTVIERKGLGRIQNRLGPNRVGPFGFLQFAADGIKTLIKEDLVPLGADRVVHFLAPIALVIPVLMAYAVLPMGRGMTATDMDAGLLFFFAVGAGTELSVFMAGWSSRNKYSLIGAMRGIAQMISYEIPLILSTLGVVMVVGSLSLGRIVAHQAGFTGWIPHWHVFTPWGFAGFILFLIAATAESNRSPFDLPEAESEIIAGYFVEYSGFKFALFFLGEYLGLFAISGLSITLFLGGWQAPLPFLKFIPSYLWFFAKLGALICLFIWVRGTVPRFRMDQLMNFAWKFMLPMALVNIVAVGLWRYLPDRFSRWGACAGLIVGAFLLLGNGLGGTARSTQRHYRFAE